MVRSALGQRGAMQRGPKPFAAAVPPGSVVLAAFLSQLPLVSTVGWVPDLGFMMLLGWRLLRSDVWPAWWGAPLGLANDLLTHGVIGLSVALFTATLLALDIADRRTMWRDYWLEWIIAALFLAIGIAAHWKVAELMGAPLPFAAMVPQLVLAVLLFPVAAWVVSRLDRWRLGR